MAPLLKIPGFAVAIVPSTMSAAADVSTRPKRPRRTISAPPRRKANLVALDAGVTERSVRVSRAEENNLVPLLFDRDITPWLPPRSNDGRRKAKRKPHGFWNDLANVERELEVVNAGLGRRGRRQMPRLAEMKALGRGDLIAALAKHGGSKHVAAILRWGVTRRSNSLPASLRTQPRLPFTGVRTKIPRREKAFWADRERVFAEVRTFARLHNVEQGTMPTQALFRTHRRTDLLNAITQHGGLRAVASDMKLCCVRSRATLRFDFDSFAKSVRAFADLHCPGKMPTAAELAQHGKRNIANAVAVHGGYPLLAARLGLQMRNTASQGAPLTWDMQRLGTELRAVTRMHYPDLAMANQLPTERMLRKLGRNDISYAVQKFGGFTKVMECLAFSPRRAVPKARKGMGARARAKTPVPTKLDVAC